MGLSGVSGLAKMRVARLRCECVLKCDWRDLDDFTRECPAQLAALAKEWAFASKTSLVFSSMYFSSLSLQGKGLAYCSVNYCLVLIATAVALAPVARLKRTL